jgi:hypothetical protein
MLLDQDCGLLHAYWYTYLESITACLQQLRCACLLAWSWWARRACLLAWDVRTCRHKGGWFDPYYPLEHTDQSNNLKWIERCPTPRYMDWWFDSGSHHGSTIPIFNMKRRIYLDPLTDRVWDKTAWFIKTEQKKSLTLLPARNTQ